MKSKLIGSFVMLGALCLSTTADADVFKRIGKIITAPVTAPKQLANDLIHKKPTGQIIQNQLDLRVKPQGEIARDAINVVQQGHNIVANIPRQAIQQLGGDWLKAYDTLTAIDRIKMEMAFTGGRFLTDCMINTNNCDPRRLTAMPVAAAMRDAYKVYIGYGVPLDPQTKMILSRVVPIQVLEAARIAIGKTPDFTVPGFLNAANEAQGGGHAVTLANLIIFSRPPNLFTQDGLIWLLHELFHIEQYMRYSGHPLEGIDGFAVEYTQHYKAMEAEAQNMAVQRFNMLRMMCSSSGGC
jgi:hypothetical protein